MADALLSRPWVKTDLHNVLDTGSNLVHPGQSDRPRVRAIRPRNSSKRRVQCIEVDEEHNAMKINDGETAVWCFIATSTMKNFKACRDNPTFASLNSKTILIERWEFSTLSVVCPAFDPVKAKSNGQICILVSISRVAPTGMVLVKVTKFDVFGGERLTTMGIPVDLGDGNRDLRATLRTVNVPNDLVRVLAAGQGLTDLRDIDGVLIAAPKSIQTPNLTWSEVDPELLKPAKDLTKGVAPSAVSGEDGRAGAALAATRGLSHGEGSGANVGNGEYPADMTQHSLEMEYDGESPEGEEDFQTQAQSLGNTFSQEPMEIRPASPSPPSPPPLSQMQHPTNVAGSGNCLTASQKNQPLSHQAPPSPESPIASNGDASDDFPLGQGHGSDDNNAVPHSLQASSPGAGRTPTQSQRSRRRREVFQSNGEVQMENQDNEAGEEDEQEDEEESSGDIVPPGFTQLDVFQESEMHAELPTERGEGKQQLHLKTTGEHEDEAETEEEGGEAEEEQHNQRSFMRSRGRGRRPQGTEDATAPSSQAADDSPPPTWKGKGKGKAREPPVAPAAVDSTATSATSPDVRTPTHPQLSPAEASCLSQELSEQTLSGLTSSSSNIASPMNSRLELSCLTQARGNEGRAHLGSGARAASRKGNINRRFRIRGGDGGEGEGAGTASETGAGCDNPESTMRRRTRSSHGNTDASGGGVKSGSGRRAGLDDEDASLRDRSSSPSTVEMEKHTGRLRADSDTTNLALEAWRKSYPNPIGNAAAAMYPVRPIRGDAWLLVNGCGDRDGREAARKRNRKRDRPLSHLLVEIDPAWRGGPRRPLIVARGYQADPMLAEWLDRADNGEEKSQDFPRIGEWLAKLDVAASVRHSKLYSVVAGRDAGDPAASTGSGKRSSSKRSSSRKKGI